MFSLKAIPDNKNVTRKVKFMLGRVENFLGKGGNVSKSCLSQGSYKSALCGKGLKVKTYNSPVKDG